MIGGFALVGSTSLSRAQNQTISGVVSSDTTWPLANSPYNLTGNVLINNGVTLTIEPGITVNLNNHYMMVNGTLTARGSNNNKIFFTGGEVIFTQYSNGWNNKTQSGSIIQYAVFSGLFNMSGGIIIHGGSLPY